MTLAERRRSRLERAIDAAEAAERDVYRLGSALIAELRAALEEARTATLARLTSASSDWTRSQQAAVLTELERQLRLLEFGIGDNLRSAMERAHLIGAGAPVEALAAAGMAIGVQPTISTAFLVAAQQHTASLIRDVSNDTIRDVDRILRRAALAQLDVWEVTKEIGSVTGKGKFASALHRGEAIARTELGRVSQTAAMVTLNQIGSSDPGMMKEWHAVLDRRTRPDHVDADGQRVALNEPFTVGGEHLMYPHDPRASASQTVNCRCIVLPWHPDFESAAVAEHLGTQHDQKTHGRRYGSMGTEVQRRHATDVGRSGGYTADPRTLRQPRRGVAVGRPGHSAVLDAKRWEQDPAWAEAEVRAWAHTNRKALARPGAHIGVWHDTASGKVVLDVVDVFADRAKGIRAGRDRGERAVYDLGHGEEIDTGGTGGY